MSIENATTALQVNATTAMFWEALTTIAVPPNSTTDYFAGIQFGTLRARIKMENREKT